MCELLKQRMRRGNYVAASIEKISIRILPTKASIGVATPAAVHDPHEPGTSSRSQEIVGQDVLARHDAVHGYPDALQSSELQARSVP
jgi:hypothetical protein